MTVINATRTSDGVKVKILHEYIGGIITGYDVAGNPFPVYTSYFEAVDGSVEFYNQIDKRKIPPGTDIGQFRWAEDCRVLKTLGYEFTDSDIDVDAQRRR